MAGFGGGGAGKITDLGPGRYVAQVRDVETVEGTAYNDKTKTVQQFKWGLEVGVNGRWVPRTIWTGTDFTDMSAVKDPQFVSKLTRLVRACGQKLPTSAAEAAAWKEDSLIGLRFGLVIAQDEETGTLSVKFVPLQQSAPAQAAGTAAAPVPQWAPPASTPAAPPPADPFESEAPLTAPPLATAAVAGPLDNWKT